MTKRFHLYNAPSDIDYLKQFAHSHLERECNHCGYTDWVLISEHENNCMCPECPILREMEIIDSDNR